MIKQIKALKNIRNFRDFSASEIEFEKKNIIYAPNGTGKTNISRVFDKLSRNETLDELLSQESSDIKELDFEIRFGDNDITKSNFATKKSSFENIYVFNSDYIENTIKSDNFSEIDVSGEVKIPIGEESNKITKLRNSIKESEKVREEKKDELEKSLDSFKELKLETSEYKLIDKNIWKELKIEKVLDSNFIIHPPVKHDDFDECERKFREISEIDENTSIDDSKLKKIDFSYINFEGIIEDLREPKYFEIFDQDVKKNIEEITKRWIHETSLLQKGVALSQEKGSCILCKRNLDDSAEKLFNEYQTYFKNEESRFKNKLTKYFKQIESLRNQILIIDNNLEKEVNSYAKLFNIDKSWCNFEVKVIVNKLKELLDAIEKKRVDLCNSLFKQKGENFDFNKNIADFNSKIEENQALVNFLKGKFSKTNEEKTKLRTAIGQKFLFEFYQDNKTSFDKIKTLNNAIETDNEELTLELEKLPKTQVRFNIESLANIFLKDFLYIDKYKIVENEGILALKLKEYDISDATQKISEGEKTMISLAFFLASSIKKFNTSDKFFKAIFIIDDPINSTSYNYFFGICNLLKFFDETIVHKLWSNEKNKLSGSELQKIILTHNTQFFNVLRENVFKGKKDRYFILSIKNLKPISKDVLKSEFENALSIIKSTINSKDYKTPIGNELRRFFETIKHFYGIKNFNADTLEKIFNGFESKKHYTFYNVINHYSHSNPEAHTDPLPVNFEPFLNQFDELISDSLFSELWNNIENT